jgi:hypothetical protein
MLRQLSGALAHPGKMLPAIAATAIARYSRPGDLVADPMCAAPCRAPEHLQRSLYDAFQLQVRYHRPRHEVTIRVTIRADGLDHFNGTVAAITSQQNAGDRSLVVAPPAWRPQRGAPSRIRTCAPASGGRCSIP